MRWHTRLSSRPLLDAVNTKPLRHHFGVAQGTPHAAFWNSCVRSLPTAPSRHMCCCVCLLFSVVRYVVTQSRHAVEVQDPQRLLRHLELLIGTSRYSEQIEEQQAQLLQLAQQMDALEQEISR